MKDIFVPNHLHLIVRGYISKPPKTEDLVNNFLSNLVKKVRMVSVIGPHSIYVNELGNEGITGIVVLATSHASIHIWDAQKPYLFQFDLYSCSEFTPKEVLEIINEHFGLENYNYTFIDRNKNEFFELERGSSHIFI